MVSYTLMSKVSRKILLAASLGSLTSMALLVTSCVDDERKDKRTQKIVVVGGGTAGIGVAAMLQNEGMKNVTVIEPKSVHYYQPLWTLVGGGVKSNNDSVRTMKQILPKGTNWIEKRVQDFAPEKNTLTLDDGTVVEYDYLVVAAGIQSDWTKVKGQVDGLQKEGSGVVSVYDFNYSKKTWQEFQSVINQNKPTSTMIFTMPPTVIKCAGAPQKIMWLLEDTLRGLGLRDRTIVQFWVPGGSMFGVKYYSDKLEVLRQERGVLAMFHHELVALDVDKKVATFKNLADNNRLVQQSYDLIHVVPHMSAPDVIKNSPFANKDGWMEVDQHTMQSSKYQNVFGLGDCTSTPNGKTAAAVTSQAPVIVHNIERLIENKTLDGKYSGYASCPLIIARKKVMLAEFGYGGKIMETFSWETGNFPLKMIGTEGAFQQRFFYFLKEQVFPFAYWNLWVRGRWYGTNGPLKPDVRDPTSTEK